MGSIQCASALSNFTTGRLVIKNNNQKFATLLSAIYYLKYIQRNNSMTYKNILSGLERKDMTYVMFIDTNNLGMAIINKNKLTVEFNWLLVVNLILFIIKD